ncbi:MAG: ABC transporter substrate-binding protein, partial [Rhodobacteraceae bacterium]|nr:ABC transporter substrate-binding protein [Paracoccaceae bacterium]
NPDNSQEANLSGYYMWRTAWDVPELTKLTEASKRESDPEKRRAIFEELDKRYRELYPSLIVFFQRIDPYVVRSNVEGYTGHPTWTTRWDEASKN